jgi:DNA-binding CsgD family transcriptional regulator
MDRVGQDKGNTEAALVAPAVRDAAASGLLGLVLDELAHGVLLVDRAGAVLHMNEAARHELSRRQLAMPGRILPAALNVDDARALLEALVKAGDGKRSLVAFHGAGRPPLSVAVLPLKSSAVPATACAALVFARASVCDSLMLCFFARSHRLTPAEEQVLNILCQGYSAPEAARQLKVAVSTVRSHVRSLCAKTQSSGVRELVSRVAVLPPVAPAFWHEPVH